MDIGKIEKVWEVKPLDEPAQVPDPIPEPEPAKELAKTGAGSR